MDWNKLISALRAKGLKLESPTLADVKKYVTDEHIDIMVDGKAADLDALYAKANARETLVFSSEADDDAIESKKAAEREKIKANRGTGRRDVPGEPDNEDDNVPQRFSIGNVERKAFNARAAMGQTTIPDADVAECFGAYLRLQVAARTNEGYAEKANDQAICRKANVSYDFGSGGFAFPTILQNELIRIRPKYDVLGEMLPAMPVNIAGESRPRRSSGVTVYSPSEGVAITESNPTGDQITLKPYEISALSTVSRKQMLGSVINFGDFVAQELIYAANKKEEEIVILGDGTSTYFNQLGFLGTLQKLVTDAGGTIPTNWDYAGAVKVGASSWASITDSEVLDTLSRVAYLENSSPQGTPIVCSRPFYYLVLKRLMQAKGGVTMMETSSGIPVPSYDGCPIMWSNAMQQTSATATLGMLHGDFRTAAKRGVVIENYGIETSDQRYWELGKIGFKLTTHRAIKVHDVGTANSSASSRTLGPIAALVTG